MSNSVTEEIQSIVEGLRPAKATVTSKFENGKFVHDLTLHSIKLNVLKKMAEQIKKIFPIEG